MSGRLAGKVALITGGARGIGRTISDMFAAEGAAVVMVGRDAETGAAAEAEIRKAGSRATFIQADVTDRDQVARAVEAAVAEYGSLTTLVNNAATGGGMVEGAVDICDPEAWDVLISGDLGGVYNVCHFAVPELVKAGGGSVISIGSTVALNGQQQLPARIAAKLGVVGLMRSIAADYGKHLVRANTLTLGLVPHDDYLLMTKGELGAALLSANLLPFFGEPRDAGYAAIYLASDEARYVTGAELVVSGGVSRVPDVLELIGRQLQELP